MQRKLCIPSVFAGIILFGDLALYFQSWAVPSVESIKLLTISEVKIGHLTKEGQNAQLIIKLSVISGLYSNYDLNRLQSY